MNDRYYRAIITLMNAVLSEKVTYVNCSFMPLRWSLKDWNADTMIFLLRETWWTVEVE